MHKSVSCKCGGLVCWRDIYSDETLKEMDKNYPDSFVIPNYVKKIGKNAFSMREYKPGGPPKKVTIPGSVTKIGDRAFYNTPLEEVTISDGVEKIGKEAFVNTPLEEVTIPNSVKSIGKEAFFGTALTDVTISKNTKIKDDTFPSEVTINRV